MITLKEYLDLIDYKITGGTEYAWHSFGENARFLDCDLNSNASNAETSIIFDSRNQTVYMAELYDYVNDVAYRLINPEYIDAYKKEAEEKNSDIVFVFDDVRWVDCVDKEEFADKLFVVKLRETQKKKS